MFSKKNSLKKNFSGNLQFINVTKIFNWGGLNHKSHAMTSSKICLLARNQDFAKGEGLTLYYSTVGLLKSTLVTNSNYLNLVRNKNLKFLTFPVCFFQLRWNRFCLYNIRGSSIKTGGFDKFFEILPISSFRCKILISRIMFLVEIKRIRINWCPRLDGLQLLVWLRCDGKATTPEAINEK